MIWRRVTPLIAVALAAGVPFFAIGAEADEPLAQEAPVSPWNDDFWRWGSPEMRQYICDHAKMAPTWCAHVEDLPEAYAAPPEEPYGPLLTADDARWLRLLGRGSLEGFTSADAAFVQERAEKTGDPDAMELLGYVHAQGIGVRRDRAMAYIWYGRAHFRGHSHVKGNMDILWQEILLHDPASAQRITALFDAEPPLEGAGED